MLEITNLTSSFFETDFLKKIAKEVLKNEKKSGKVSLVFVGPNRMKRLNFQYKKKNRVTDVLSFPGKAKNDFVFPPEEQNELGEIVICLREIKKRAKRNKSDFKKELALTFIHGLLHLCGYDHQKPKEKEIMEKKEENYLKLFFNHGKTKNH